MITDADVRAAEMRMQATLDTAPRAIAARYDRRVSRIVISLSSGLELAFPPHIVEGLSEAKPADLTDVEISPTGLGKLGGSSRSEAKASASRNNGKLGGRPRKTAV